MRRRITIHPAYDRLSGFLSQLPGQYDALGRLVHDGRNTVRCMEQGGVTMVVKRFRRPLWFQRVAYTLFRPTKARRAYEYALRYRELGFDTPAPIACIEERPGGLFSRGYFVAEADFRPSCMPFDGRTEAIPDEMLEALARHVAAFHERGILHGDLSLSNILCDHPRPEEWHFAFIDINRSRFLSRAVPRRAAAREVAVLTYDGELLRRFSLLYARFRHWDEAAFAAATLAQLVRRTKRKGRLARLQNRRRRR